MKYLRLISFYIVCFMAFITSLLSFLLVDLFSYIYKFTDDKKLYIKQYLFHKIFKNYFKLLFWIKIKVVGECKMENIILTSNHISLLDSIILGISLFDRANLNINILVWHTFFEIPILGYIFKSLNFIPVGYKDYNTKNDLEGKIIKNLQNGKSLYILFEGAINKNPTKLQDIKPGLFNYHKCSNGIKFIGLKGIDKIWPAKGQPSGYGTIEIKFFDGLYKFYTFEETKEKIHELYDNYIIN